MQLLSNRVETWGIISKYRIVTCHSFLCGGVSQCIPFIKRDYNFNFYIFNVRSHRNSADSCILRSGYVYDFTIVSLSFLVTFAINFDKIFWDDRFCPHILTNKRLVWIRVIMKQTLGSFVLHPSLGPWERTLFALGTFMKSIMLRLQSADFLNLLYHQL